MKSEHQLHAAKTSLAMAYRHLEAGFSPSTVLFAWQGAREAVRGVYTARTGRIPSDGLSILEMIRQSGCQEFPIPVELILLLEDLGPRCAYPDSLIALIEEIPLDRAERVVKACDTIVAWATEDSRRDENEDDTTLT
ncbi:MAG: hypothetical protein LUQ50_13425 [Methanospirillum sp.]|uniref:hypothetical protein n=1 Tax=Methanospirillum sp. TaxID=45200 RepID=UPI002372EE35|nr:hypothetical protein [Methanospirillum sp.]MDD1730056.1 hypothetical protein [Methanospirillum sp.]